MKPLEEIFEKQAGSGSVQESRAGDEIALIRFSIDGSVYAVDISHVLEVTELLPIVRYPEYHGGHLGIVNLRGNIIPVLTFRDQGEKRENRLIVLEFSPGHRFCAMVSAPKKVTLSAEAAAGQQVVTIDGMPARLLTEKDFPAINALAAGA